MSLSFLGLCGVKFLELLFLLVFAFTVMPLDYQQDMARLRQPITWAWIVGLVVTSITGVFWYMLVHKQNVMAGALYEVKYIVMLVVIYTVFGTKPVTVNTVFGIAFAMGSIYFVSKI